MVKQRSSTHPQSRRLASSLTYGAAALLAVLAVVLAAIVGGPEWALLVAVVLAVGAVIVLVQRRSAARALAATRRLERTVRAAAGAGVDVTPPRASGTVDELLAARILDVPTYSAFAGREFEHDADAAADFLARGMQLGLAPSALLSPAWLPEAIQARYVVGDLLALLEFLRRKPSSMPPLSVAFSPALVEADEDALRSHPGGCLGWFLQHADPRDLLPTSRVHARWGEFQGAIGDAIFAHRAGEGARAPRGGVVAGRTTLVLQHAGDPSATVEAVGAALESARGEDLEVLVVVRRPSLVERIQLAAQLSGRPRARIVDATGPTFVPGAASGDACCVMLRPGVLRPGWLPPLRAELALDGVAAVQPLVLGRDDAIVAAGVEWGESRAPGLVLAGRPPEDAHAVDGNDLDALSGPVVLFETSALAAAGDALLEADPARAALGLSLHLRERGGELRCVSGAAVVVDDETRRSLGAAAAANDDSATRLPAPLHAAPLVPRSNRSRWGIRFASPGGDAGDRWGDTAFAESLADALRAQGVDVVTYRHPATEQVERMHDDVSLVIRGKHRLPPVPGVTNVLWIISHPGTVTDEELAEFDLVFAASAPWASKRSAESGIEIAPLLQCTDASRFAPEGDVDGERPAVFVGSVHPGRRRAVVADAIAAGVDLRVIGEGWQRMLPLDVLERLHMPNERLGAVYRSAEVVLADHWRTMADNGFIQNRVFDALACGVPVVSDPVAGMAETLRGAVAEYRSIDELADLCSGRASHPVGDSAARTKLARWVLDEHSFDARARALVDAVGRWEGR